MIVIGSRRWFYYSEYPFFLRVSILMALAVVFRPRTGAGGRSGRGDLIGNQFVIESPLGVFLASSRGSAWHKSDGPPWARFCSGPTTTRAFYSTSG